ncbi:MAG TPA: glutamine-hydrolyzing GMP synthase, partial [Ktedonobacterales bacterium]|nr:glutamine-hydrolyzing GMP synthase [Ktedonobacterales bacterium]
MQSPVFQTEPGASSGGQAAPAAREMVAILDYGSQYSRLIARRVRECRVYCELLPADTTLDELRRLGARGVILSGGPDSVYDDGARKVDQEVLESDLPVLGICYGMQLLAHQLGGHVERHSGRSEYGPSEIHLVETVQRDDTAQRLFAGLATGSGIAVWMSHGDTVSEVPPGFAPIARSESGALAAMGDARGRIGIQFHPEVRHTPQGSEILENFLFGICGCTPSWTAGAFIDEAVERIRAQVGDAGRLICGLSGGVDSAVAALLVHRAIG